MRIRQLALVARDLEPTLSALCGALDVEICHRDPGVETFGLHNGLMPLGDDFLEVVSPLPGREPGSTTAGRLLGRRQAAGEHPSGDGGYMVIFQSPDLEADRARMKELDVRVVWEIAFDDMATIHLHPRDVGAAIVSLDWADPPASWRWAGPGWQAHRRTGTVTGIAGAVLAAKDPIAMARRWAAVVQGGEAVAAGEGAEVAVDDGQRLRFVATEGLEGLVGLELRKAPGATARQLEVCGVRIELV
ncbi:MAG: VOC family protein [Myxococcales bacterium]|nr:VOC family protein [Myxococcales bacterium]